jgi:type IV pilus biogenesis protein CpaD/CtpE
MKFPFVRAIVATAALLLAGCATTPPEVKAAVVDTTAMLAQMQQELQRFRTARAASDERIVELSRDIQLSAAEDQQVVNRTLLTLEATGSADAVQLFGRLKALAQGLKADDDALQALRQDLDIELAALVKPLPNSTAKLRAAILQQLVRATDRFADDAH